MLLGVLANVLLAFRKTLEAAFPEWERRSVLAGVLATGAVGIDRKEEFFMPGSVFHSISSHPEQSDLVDDSERKLPLLLSLFVFGVPIWVIIFLALDIIYHPLVKVPVK